MKDQKEQTLGSLQNQFRLYAVCSPCGRTKELDIPALIKHFGKDATLQIIRSHVRCSACHLRTQDIRIVYAGAADKAAEFRYRKR